MADFAPYQKLGFAFAQVLNDLSKTWPTSDIAYVHDIVAHAEYGEALENLIAIGLSKGQGFNAGQQRRIEAIGSLMGLNTAALMETARAQHHTAPTSTAA